MIPLEKLLARFKNLANTDKAKKELIMEVCKEYGIPVIVSQISFSKNTIFFKVSPIIKTEIALKKQELLKKIKTLPGLEMIQNIQ